MKYKLQDIVEQAQLETKYKDSKGSRKVFELFEEELQRFAEIIQTYQKEIDAKLCDDECNPLNPSIPVSTYKSGCYATAEYLAEAIRSGR